MPYKDPTVRRKKQREYMRTYTKERYAKDPVFRQSVLDKAKKRHDTCMAAIDPVILEFKKDGCQLCPEKDTSCLVAHHVDPSQKEVDISALRYGSRNIEKTIQILRKELAKCLCICMNCHAKVHAGKIDLGKVNY